MWRWRRYTLYRVVCLYVCMLPTFLKITRLNCMKFSGMICHHPRTNRLDFGSDQVKGHEKVKNYWTTLHEIFRGDLSSSKDQSIRFWERSGQRTRSRSRKGQKRIFVITCSVFVRFIWNQCQNVHFSIPYPLIWWQMWRWQRYAAKYKWLRNISQYYMERMLKSLKHICKGFQITHTSSTVQQFSQIYFFRN